MTEIESGYRVTFLDENGVKRHQMFRNMEEAMLASLSLKEPMIEEVSTPKIIIKGQYNYAVIE